MNIMQIIIICGIIMGISGTVIIFSIVNQFNKYIDSRVKSKNEEEYED